MSEIPSQDEVMKYFDTLSNWGRWGEDDQLGTLNFLDSSKTKQAISLVQEGVSVSCARPITFENTPDVAATPVHYMVESLSLIHI